MRINQVLYSDSLSKKVATHISHHIGLPINFFKIRNPIIQLLYRGRCHLDQPSGSLLIGGNRWKHHYALNLTERPIVALDAHSDMSYDEMIVLGLPRPYNWLYFKLKRHISVCLVLQPVQKLRRFDISVPIESLHLFKLYAFTPSGNKASVTHSLCKTSMVNIENPEKASNPLKIQGKQVSIDWDITRCVNASRVLQLLDKVCIEGDTFDIWLDEGTKKTNQISDHVSYCTEIILKLNS